MLSPLKSYQTMWQIHCINFQGTTNSTFIVFFTLMPYSQSASLPDMWFLFPSGSAHCAVTWSTRASFNKLFCSQMSVFLKQNANKINMFGRQHFFFLRQMGNEGFNFAWCCLAQNAVVISSARKEVYTDHIKSQLRCRPPNAAQHHSFLNNYEEDPRWKGALGLFASFKGNTSEM